MSLALVAAACSSDGATSGAATTDAAEEASATAPSGGATGALVAPTFEIAALPARLSHLDPAFTKHTRVFGIDVVGTPAVDDGDIVHAANVAAQYIDNDEDGQPDNPDVATALASSGATLLMPANEADAERAFTSVAPRGTGQDLRGDETNEPGRFDATLEEVHHLILSAGWSSVFPGQLVQGRGSQIAAAMDGARGGVFNGVPASYPAGAWYTYDDQTCDYACQVTEYSYWAHTSLLGAQDGPGRCEEIVHEWQLCTPEQVRQQDGAATAILTGSDLGLPTVLPDGTYRA